MRARNSLRRPSYRQTVEAAKRGNDYYADLAGKPRLDYSQTLKPKRAAPVRNLERVSEAQVNGMIREGMSQREDLVLWRNNRGQVILPGGERLMYGVGPNGSSDWIGYRVVVVTPSMVGTEIAQFVAVEAKAPDAGEPADAQQRFIDHLNGNGAVAIVVRERKDLDRL